MTEPQPETPQEETPPDVETEIAEQMTPDDDESPGVVAPNPDEQDVTPTGPGPESPFQPPDLKPDDEPEPEPDEPDEPEALADYAPGVSEARLLSEREREKRKVAVDKENLRHAKRIGEIEDEKAQELIPCPVCCDEWLGFVRNPEVVPLGEEMKQRMGQLLGLADWNEMPTASWAAKCETCDGYGKIKTGSKVTGREVTGCEDCGESGWRNLRVPAQVNGNTDEVPSGVTGPTTVQDLEPDPRVQALRSEGYMVIPRVEVASG